LVGFGSDSNAQDVKGATPLHLAASALNSNAKCVQYLLQHKADSHLRNKRGFTAIHYAVAGGNQAALEALLNVSSSGNQIPALFNSSTEQEQPLPALTPIHLAAYYGHSKILKLLLPLFSNTNIQEDSGKTPLDLAAYQGHKECIELLLQSGASVSVQDFVTRRTPIHCAAAMGHADCLSLLLKNVDCTKIVNRYDTKQRTALSLAVANNHSECAALLLKYKADCNLLDINKHTPLFRAVINERDNQMVKLLLKYGARVTLQDVNGKTPLHLAAACGRLYALAALVKTDPTAATLKDDQGCTVLHWACYNGNSNCVEYLLNNNVFDSLESK
jgi:serine/threonine-protein phosphatase 6 regulatory ankyrin repeat subunit A